MIPPSPLRDDAERLWTAALAAVHPQRLVAALAPETIPLPRRGRIAVVGAGKAADGMAAAVAERLDRAGVASARITGLVSVPEGQARSCGGIEVRATRPRGSNQPTAAVVAATREMIGLVGALGDDDLAIALVTGGGSALLEAPADGVSLDELVAVSAALSRAGADITALNRFRRAVSRVKAGGLARACRAGRLVVLVLSDVIGDPLEAIASGPCMPEPADPAAALAVLARFGIAADTAPGVFAHLAEAARLADPARGPEWTTPAGVRVSHHVVGNNAAAVDAALSMAAALGYRIASPGPAHPSPDEAADDVGRRLLRRGRDLAAQGLRDGVTWAWIEGGEATVTVPADHGRGGRNQQTVLAALADAVAAPGAGGWPPGLVIASIGTDGEDGPTDAAGAVADADVARCASHDPAALVAALGRRDALPLLERCGGLVVTGPTGTNVADLRIVLARGG